MQNFSLEADKALKFNTTNSVPFYFLSVKKCITVIYFNNFITGYFKEI